MKYRSTASQSSKLLREGFRAVWGHPSFALMTAPWNASLNLWAAVDSESALWRLPPAEQPAEKPLDLILKTLHAGAITASRLPLWNLESRELGNKIRAFAHFHLQEIPGELELGAYDRLWIEEGIGFRRDAGRNPGQDRVPDTGVPDTGVPNTGVPNTGVPDTGVPNTGVPDTGVPNTGVPNTGTPPRHLTVVQASGLGLALALREVQLFGDGSAQSISTGVDAFVRSVDRELNASYRLAALENLGLAVRTLRPELLKITGAQAQKHDFEGPFWHGSGRGFYFAPTHLMSGPAVDWPALNRLVNETPEHGRADAVAGLVWALTLVNIRHPEVVSRRLRSLGQGSSSENRTRWAAQGLASALMLWRASTSNLDIVERFLAYPFPNPLIEPAREAWNHLFPVLERDNRIAELFQYRSFSGGSHGRA